LGYLKTREQFGRRIGSFQVLQHRMVDMEIACEEARAMWLHASGSLESTVAQRRRAVSAAKSRLGQTSLFVGHQAVQLHGGIGTTDDLIISHYLKRLVMLESSFGNGDYHRRRFLESTASLPVG
jgi:alkylation response protein AidB-like acyl-CoA dehydrogenase